MQLFCALRCWRRDMDPRLSLLRWHAAVAIDVAVSRSHRRGWRLQGLLLGLEGRLLDRCSCQFRRWRGHLWRLWLHLWCSPNCLF